MKSPLTINVTEFDHSKKAWDSMQKAINIAGVTTIEAADALGSTLSSYKKPMYLPEFLFPYFDLIKWGCHQKRLCRQCSKIVIGAELLVGERRWIFCPECHRVFSLGYP